MTRRVVVTGIGILSPLGLDSNTTWASIVAGKSGVGPITRFDATGYRTQIAAEIQGLDLKDHFSPRDARRMDPFVQYALIASREAVANSGITFDQAIAERTAVIIASGIGGITTTTEQTLVLQDRGPDRVSPFLIPMILPDTAAGMVAIEFGLKGPNMAVTSACASGANAIGESYEIIRRGAADIAVCGGTEAGIVPIAVAGFSAMRALSERNDDPQCASRPFDRDRDGFVIGEGAGILILESLEHAEKRGASPLAEMIGYGSTDDAFHIAAPDENGAGAAACMRLALASAHTDGQEVDYINAHGTSTPLNDTIETRAIKNVLGNHAYRIPVSSTKSMTGHLLGAAGSLEAALTVRSVAEGIVPPTINLHDPDPDCDLDYVPHNAREHIINIALSNSFGFGGHNVCLVFRQI